jgi:hypothetical protein
MFSIKKSLRLLLSGVPLAPCSGLQGSAGPPSPSRDPVFVSVPWISSRFGRDATRLACRRVASFKFNGG